MASDRIIEKIRGLLSLGNSKSNSNDFEAQSALLKAHELMAKHGISVQDTEVEEETPITAKVCHSTDKRGFRKILGLIIAKNFRCEVMLVRDGEVCMFGLQDDVEAAVSAYNFAYDYAFRQGTKLYNMRYNNGYSTKGVFNSYVTGFINGLREKLEAQSKELMVVTSERVKEAFKEETKGNRSTSAKIRNNGIDYNAYNKGVNDGRNVFARKEIGA